MLAPGITADTASSAIPSLSACTATSEADASVAKNTLPFSKIRQISAFSETTNTFALRLGGTFMDVRTVRIARTASLIVSMAFSSAAKFSSSV